MQDFSLMFKILKNGLWDKTHYEENILLIPLILKKQLKLQETHEKTPSGIPTISTMIRIVFKSSA